MHNGPVVLSNMPKNSGGSGEARSGGPARLYTIEKQMYAYGELHKGVFYESAGFGGASEIRRKVPVPAEKPLTGRYFPSYNQKHEREHGEPPPGPPRFFQQKFAALKW